MKHAPGEHLVQELTWVHSAIRRDLAACRELARQVDAGAHPDEVRATVAALKTRGPLWQLRVNCLTHCRFVHHHHGAESALLFPALRRAHPELRPVVRRLEADHQRISDLLDQVAALADLLGTDPTGAEGYRGRLVTALDTLAVDLLSHLDYEEESLSPTLRTMRAWPF